MYRLLGTFILIFLTGSFMVYDLIYNLDDVLFIQVLSSRLYDQR